MRTITVRITRPQRYEVDIPDHYDVDEWLANDMFGFARFVEAGGRPFPFDGSPDVEVLP